MYVETVPVYVLLIFFPTSFSLFPFSFRFLFLFIPPLFFRTSLRSNDIRSLVPSGLQSRFRRLSVLECADKRIRVLLLVEVSKGVVDSTMTSFICANVQDEVFHRAVSFRHVPVLHERTRTPLLAFCFARQAFMQCYGCLPGQRYPGFETSHQPTLEGGRPRFHE